MSSPPRHLATDALLNLLLPVWQVAIALCVLVVVAAASIRLIRRGPSRMSTAMVIAGGAIVVLALLGWLFPG